MKYNEIEGANIIRELQNANYEAYFVGGCVRDELMNKTPKDWDIVTNATPEQIKEVFGETVTCGNNFLVSIVDGHEVATYRKDKADHADVATSLKEDVLRRDFTINGLARTVEGDVIDYVGGVQDIEHRVLRAIGNPIDRFIEDPVRILRGLRFASVMDLGIHYKTQEAMELALPLLDNIPTERFHNELIKVFSTNSAYKFIKYLLNYGIFYKFFPSMKKLIKDGGKYHGETVIEHCIDTVMHLDLIGNTNPKLKLAGLYHDIGKIYHEYNENNEVVFLAHNTKGDEELISDLRRLHFSNEVIDYVKMLKDTHMFTVKLDDGTINKKQVRKLYARLTEHNVLLKDWFKLRYADKKANRKKSDNMPSWANYRKTWKDYCRCFADYHCFSITDLEINGKDVMSEFGLEQGKQVGVLLKEAYVAVLDDIVPNNREELIAFLHRGHDIETGR